jgi:hypothetical protein
MSSTTCVWCVPTYYYGTSPEFKKSESLVDKGHSLYLVALAVITFGSWAVENSNVVHLKYCGIRCGIGDYDQIGMETVRRGHWKVTSPLA